MAPATARFYEAVVNGALTHSGDSRLARHIGNAVLREDARGARLAKERKDPPRRIDAAVAAVMAHDRAAVLAGAREPSIYI
jgi:phage terminase large subunit-like protein